MPRTVYNKVRFPWFSVACYVRMVMENNSLNAASTLAWQIPSGVKLSLRFRLVRIMCVTVVFALIVSTMTAEELRWQMLGGVGVLGLLLASWNIFRAACEEPAAPNVWLNHNGLHWVNHAGEERMLGRALIRAYWIGTEPETRSTVPTLTFLLDDDFLSQPIELHPPAMPAQVQTWLRTAWQIEPRSDLPSDERAKLELAVQYDQTRQFWQFIGQQSELEKLLAIWSDLAIRFALPPVGARGKRFILEHEGAECDFVIAPYCVIEFVTLSLPPERLRELVQAFRERLATNPEEAEVSLHCDTGHHWRIIFTVPTEEEEAVG